MPRPPISGGTSVWLMARMSPSRVYSTKASRPSSLTAKRPRSRSWPIPLPSTHRSPVFVSAIIALSLVVAALRSYAALGRLQPALGGVQFGRLHRGLPCLVAAIVSDVLAPLQLLPGRWPPIMLLLCFPPLAGFLHPLAGGTSTR